MAQVALDQVALGVSVLEPLPQREVLRADGQARRVVLFLFQKKIQKFCFYLIASSSRLGGTRKAREECDITEKRKSTFFFFM